MEALRMMHRSILASGLGTGLATTVLLAAAWSASPAQQQQEALDRIVAVVDNDIILESELSSQVQFLALNNRIDAKTPGLRDQVLQNMINERLIVARAIEDSVTVTDEEVQQQLDQSIQQRVQQVGSEARLEELYGMPLSRIKREYRDEMRKNLLAQRLQQQRFGTASVGRFEVEEFFRTFKDSLPPVPEEIEISRIYIEPRASADAKAAARRKAESLLDSLRAGADFTVLAKRHSQDVGSAPQGGDLGLVRRGQFVKEFESAVFALNDGQISPIVETDFGFHIIQLIERRGDAVHARHILVRVQKTANADSATVGLLDSLRKAALGGQSFAELARKFSEDKESKMQGGSLGTIELEQVDKTWYPSVAPLKEGEISPPFRVSAPPTYGYQIVQMRKRTPPHTMSLETDYHKIETLALNYKRSKDYQTWMTELRSKIYWQVKGSAPDSGHTP
jgi:peptidyl-prolyl cis-trans isomerase SurA